jgi:hypothetical protein
MRKKTAARPVRQRRLMPTAYERIRALETLKVNEGNAAQVELLADVLALWTRYMLEVNPSTAAPRIYRALMDAWKDNRGELYDPDDDNDQRDRRTVNFNVAFHSRFAELSGEPTPTFAAWEGNVTRAAELAREMISELNGMRERVYQAATVQGKAGDAPRGKPFDGESANPARPKELRQRLDEMDDDITDCSARMKLEKEIYDLEHPKDSDNWSAWEGD